MNTTNHTSHIGEDAANGAIGEREAFGSIHEFLGIASKRLYPTPDKPNSDWAKLRAAVDALALLEARAASTSANVAQGAEAVKSELKRAIDLLDAHLGDSDPLISEDMTQEEIEHEYPVMAAMQILVGMMVAPPAQTALTDDARDAAQYPHAAIGAALISTGLYDRMNDITSGDREARHLIEELISKVDPILDRWHNAALTAAQSASGGKS